MALGKPVQAKPASKGKYAHERETTQRPNVILQSMLELLKDDKDYSSASEVSGVAGFTVVQHEVDKGLNKVHRSGGRDFYRAPVA